MGEIPGVGGMSGWPECRAGIGGLEKAVRRGFQAFVVFLEPGESIEVF